jgi:glucose-6-phosphate isomerase
VEGVIWGIDSFDQWGVERGKNVASSLAPVVAGEKRYKGGNLSTRNLLKQVRKKR